MKNLTYFFISCFYTIHTHQKGTIARVRSENLKEIINSTGKFKAINYINSATYLVLKRFDRF